MSFAENELDALSKKAFEGNVERSVKSIFEVEDDPVVRDNMSFKSDKDISEWVKNSNPSDLIVMTDSIMQQFFGIMKKAGITDSYGIPCDIFEADTIPIRDCVLEFSDSSCIRLCLNDSLDGYFTYQMKEETPSSKANPFVVSFPLTIVNDSVCLDLTSIYTSSYILVKRFFDKVNCTGFMILMDQILKLWYTMQICLLNPQVKDQLMRKDGKQKLNGVCLTSKKQGRKAKYVKRHRVETDIFKTATDETGIERKTLSWYVIGHWRNYANGKKSFVNGYWKGPLRHTKKNLDGNRERVIA